MTKFKNIKLKGILRKFSSITMLLLLASILLACVPNMQNFTPSDPSTGEVESSNPTSTSVTTATDTTPHGEPVPSSRHVFNEDTLPSKDKPGIGSTVASLTDTSKTSTTTTIAPNVAAKPVGKVGKAHSIRVFEDVQVTVVYGLDEANQEIPIEAFYCSTGYNNATPKAPEGRPIRITAYRPAYMKFSLLGDCYVRYPTQIYGDYFFHSVPYEYSSTTGPKHNECWIGGMHALGRYKTTGGCIRLSVRDAVKLQGYAYPGMPLYVLTSSSGYSWPTPQSVPGVQTNSPYSLSSRLGWDPTDWHQDNPYLGLVRAPSISGDQALTLTEGYKKTSTGAYTVSGNPSPEISITNNPDSKKIVWNNTSKKIDITAGLAAGKYEFSIKVSNSAGNATLKFTLIVEAKVEETTVTEPPTETTIDPTTVPADPTDPTSETTANPTSETIAETVDP
ncbi:MAG: L,D-transpeptidase [Clostridiaceae bacterium]|nr:L,D-transpeptidase [Clostridiaceae bacterium]